MGSSRGRHAADGSAANHDCKEARNDLINADSQAHPEQVGSPGPVLKLLLCRREFTSHDAVALELVVATKLPDALPRASSKVPKSPKAASFLTQNEGTIDRIENHMLINLNDWPGWES